MRGGDAIIKALMDKGVDTILLDMNNVQHMLQKVMQELLVKLVSV